MRDAPLIHLVESGPMNTKDLSPAYFTSLVAVCVGALMIGTSTTWVLVLGWVALLGGVALNIFATLIMIQRLKGGPLPALIAGQGDGVQEDEAVDEGQGDQPEGAQDDEPEAVTESHQVVPAETPTDDRIFRPRARSPRPHVR